MSKISTKMVTVREKCMNGGMQRRLSVSSIGANGLQRARMVLGLKKSFVANWSLEKRFNLLG